MREKLYSVEAELLLDWRTFSLFSVIEEQVISKDSDSTLVALRVSARSHRTYTGSYASPEGIERVSKIVMCIIMKLCYCLQKLQIS